MPQPKANTPSTFKSLDMRIRRAVHRRFSSYSDSKFHDPVCPACGQDTGILRRGVLGSDLVFAWGLSAAWANWVDQREGLRCVACRANLRSRQLAQTLVQTLNQWLDTSATHLKQLCTLPQMQKLTVAEINAAGDLHIWLQTLPKIHYSEYGSTQPTVPSEDLHCLSYATESFDLVVNSDVLEHVPDVDKALTEIFRILKPNGLYVFTVPVVWPQEASRRCADIQHGEIVHLTTPSYHGDSSSPRPDLLVFHEFGADFVARCRQVGFAVDTFRDQRNPSLTTFIAKRPT